MDISDRYARDAMELTKIICANPANALVPCEETAEQIAEFIKTLVSKLKEN